MSETTPPPSGQPIGNQNRRYIFFFFLFFFGAVALFLFRKKNLGPEGPFPPAAPSASALPHIPTISHTEQDIPPPVEPEVEPEKVEKNQKKNHAVSGCDQIKCSGMSTPELESALALRARQVRACYERELAVDPSLEGKMVLKVKIAESGQVCGVQLVENAIAAASVGQCSVARFRSAFPGPKGGCIETIVPIHFQHR